MSIRVQWRRGTAAEWTSANPTLANGEAGFESDTGKFKIGDGATAWSDLEYTGSAADVAAAQAAQAAAEAAEASATTSAQAASESAETAAGSATDASTAQTAAESARDAAEVSADEAAASAANTPGKGYATLAALNADLVPADGTLAVVTNDPTPANNGTYRKSGATGTGSWVLSADRVTALEGETAALAADVADLGGATRTEADAGTAIDLPSKPAGYRKVVIDGETYLIPYFKLAVVDKVGGTLADPISAGSTLNKTSTWIQIQSAPVPSTLREFQCYATAAGSLKLKLFTPTKGGGFTVTDLQTLTCAVGLNTFSVAGSTLNSAAIPAHGLIGFHTPSAGGATVSFKSGEAPFYSAGYLAAVGDVSGVVATASVAYGNELQSQFMARFERGETQPGAYWLDDDFAGTVAPPYCVPCISGSSSATANWIFSVAGQATCAGTGLANFCDFFPTTNADRCTFAVEFEFTGASDRFAIYRKPILGDTSATEGTIGEADVANNQLVLYATWAGGTTYALPAVASSLVLSNLTLVTGRRYRLELTKDAKVNSLRIIDTTTDAEQTLSVDNDATNLSGFCYGRPGFANLAGSATVKEAQFYPSATNPRVLIVGDSITEGSGTDQETSYAQLTLDALATPGNGWYSGDGGTLAANALRRLRHDLRLSIPRYVIVYVGANNANSSAATTAFSTDIQNIYDAIANAGATPVICTLTPNSDATQNGRVSTMNAVLLGKGWRLARFDIALSVGGDGTTYDAAKMSDGVHPNTAGHAALKARLLADWPEIFD